MRKLGEPQRKVCRIEEQITEGNTNSEAEKSATRPPPEADGPVMRKPTSPTAQNSKKKQTKRLRKEEQRTKMELKAKMRKEKKAMKEKKRKEKEDTL